MLDFAELFIKSTEDSLPTDQHIKSAAEFSDILQDPQSSAFLRMVIKAAANFVGEMSDNPADPVHNHLKRASLMGPEIHDHHLELYQEICAACREIDAVTKSASATPLSMLTPLGLTAKGLAYGALGAGAGTGALYWLLSRHSRQGDAELESMQQQVDYYDDLHRRLSSRLKDKYGYDAISR